MKSKRAQVTVFIIVGIVILIGVSIFLFLRESSTRSILEEGSSRVITERVSSEFRPVQEFIISCLDDVAKRGILRLGQQGGYIDSNELVADRFNPTSSRVNSIFFWPGREDYKVAYWWHMDSSDSCFADFSCSFSSKKPNLRGNSGSMERFIKDYVEEKIYDCFEDFNYLSQSGFDITGLSEAKVDVTIAQENVFIEMRYPITAELGSNSQNLNIYATALDVNLREIYELASLIAEYQAQNSFLEVQLLELISLYSGTSRNSLLPPFYDPATLRFAERRHAWTATEVKRSLISILASYVPMFSIYESRNFDVAISDNPTDRAVFDLSWIFLSASDDEDDVMSDFFEYDVTFAYRSWWDLYLNMGSSEILSPENMNLPGISDVPLLGSFIDSFLPVRYQFGYDISYPVLVTIRSPEAFNNEGFTFNFALQSNVRNNLPVFSVENFQGSEALLSSYLFNSPFCSDRNLNSGVVSIDVLDADTFERIEGATLSYHCVIESCNIGLTRESEDDFSFQGRFPVCAGGILEVSAQGYESKSIPFSTELDVDVNLPPIELYRLREKTVQARVIGLIKAEDSWSLNPTPVDLRLGESVVFTFTKIPSNEFDRPFSAVAFLDGPSSTIEIDLVPGEYEVSGQLVLDTSINPDIGEVVIPSRSERVCPCLRIAGNCMCSRETIEYPEISFGEIFPSGSLLLNDEHGGSWFVSSEDLDSSDVITFYIISSPYITPGISLSHNDLREFGKSEFYSRRNRNLVDPCFGDDEVCPLW